MPTSTAPFEVLLEFTNDCAELATLQLCQGTSFGLSTGMGGGPVIRLDPKDSVSLVLNAGATYHYTVQRSTLRAQVSIRTWRDTKCKVSDVFSGDISHMSVPWTPLSQTVTVVQLPGNA
ncbi:hypothetical protein FA15DRAFT_690234 [Coprinopsis marcescibilis]|uniref:Uncharacterized protein n=1 Tax=Coprinopsis marcescibilis TaxID=230819 RepID=A0A5C3LCN9_COPMA|nr:hypothetical protein FA15DRAFT_690234 [Coprinopsis marcescibilis]